VADGESVGGLSEANMQRRWRLCGESLAPAQAAQPAAVHEPLSYTRLLAANILLEVVDQAFLLGDYVFNQVANRQQANQFAVVQHR
jgi:hypothetical protein